MPTQKQRLLLALWAHVQHNLTSLEFAEVYIDQLSASDQLLYNNMLSALRDVEARLAQALGGL